VDGIIAELEWTAQNQTGRPVVETIFFGGGTPSLMQGGSVGRILQKIAALWPMANDPEINLEGQSGIRRRGPLRRLPRRRRQPRLAGHSGR